MLSHSDTGYLFYINVENVSFDDNCIYSIVRTQWDGLISSMKKIHMVAPLALDSQNIFNILSGTLLPMSVLWMCLPTHPIIRRPEFSSSSLPSHQNQVRGFVQGSWGNHTLKVYCCKTIYLNALYMCCAKEQRDHKMLSHSLESSW